MTLTLLLLRMHCLFFFQHSEHGEGVNWSKYRNEADDVGVIFFSRIGYGYD